MFRSKALAKLQSPEKLDEPQLLIRRKNKVVVVVIAAVPLVALTWGILGSVPEEGRGQGILMTPGSVKAVQAPGAGQMVRWLVREGDSVNPGQVLGYIEQIAIEQDIKEGSEQVEELRERNKVVGELHARYSASQRESIEARREVLRGQIDNLEKYIENTKGLSAKTHKRNVEALGAQEQSLTNAKKAADEVAKSLEGRLESYKRLSDEKLIPDETLRDVRKDAEDAKVKQQEIDVKRQELSLQNVELTQAKINTQTLISARENTLTNLKVQLKELDNVVAQLDKADSETKFRQKTELSQRERVVEQSKKRFNLNREIKTEYAGRVLELSAREGQIVSQGQQVAQIDTRKDEDELIAVAYFTPKEGKVLTKGSIVRVTPSTVDKKKYGGVIGVVESVSDYPVTVDYVTTQVGNRTVAEALTLGGFTIEVKVRLTTSDETPSGFKWTSKMGPHVKLSAGTSTEVWATVEWRKPISYILPKIKGWSGV